MRFPFLLASAALILNCAAGHAQDAAKFVPEISKAIGLASVPALSADGEFLAVAQGDVAVYRAVTGELLARLPIQGARSGLAFAPDGQTLAIGVTRAGQPVYPPQPNGGEIQVWNWRATQLTATLPDYSFTSLRFTSDGAALESDSVPLGAVLVGENGYERDKARLAALNATIATRWEIATKSASRRVNAARLPVAFGRSGEVALHAPDEDVALIYDDFPLVEAVQTGALPTPDARVTLDDGTTLVAFSPDGAVLYQNTDNVLIRRTVIETGQTLPEFRNSGVRTHLGVSRDILVADKSGRYNETTAYDLIGGQALWTNPLGQISLSADGKTVVGIEPLESSGEWDEGTPRLLDARSGDVVGGVNALAPTTPDRFLLLPDNRLVLRRGRATRGLPLQMLNPSDGKATALSDFPKGVNASAMLWNAARGEIWIADGFANGGDAAAIAGVRRWNGATGAALGLLPESKLQTNWAFPAIALSPDGRVLATSDNEFLRAFDLQTNQLLWKSALAEQRYLCFAPDGKTLVVAAERGGANPVSLWDSATGVKTRDLNFLDFNSSRAPSFAPDGKTLALSLQFLSWPDLKVLGAGSLSSSDFTPRTSWNAAGDRYLRAHGSSADLWDVSDAATPRLISKWEGTSAQFGAGETVWSQQNGALVVQSARDASELGRLYLVGESDWLAFTPDGFFAGTPAGLAYLNVREGEKVWRASELPARNDPQKLAAIFAGK